MELEHDLKLFGFFIDDDKLQTLASPAMQDQEPKPQLPSKPSFKLFGFEIDIVDTDKPIEAFEPKIIPVEAAAIKPKKTIKRQRFRAPKPQTLPTRYRDFLIEKGADLETLNLILTRTLPETDMRKDQARLSMPCNQVKEGFLNHGEEVFINGKTEESVQGGGKRKLCNKLNVRVVDPSLGFHMMKLAKWNYVEGSESNNSWLFALTNDWIKLVRENGLVVGDSIQVWSVRIQNGQLGFVIHKMEEEPHSGSTSTGSCKRSKQSN